MFEQIGKERKWVPAAIYVPHSDWSKTGPKVGKWGSYKKQTSTEEVMKQQSGKPAPTNYDTFNLHEEKVKCALNL